ncbi:C4-dicarboxylate TRAP transporter substrate-binding protein [Desertibacillus haloalkaliphilus]|uniref:C4-dicarboxylate TRAP transporter substrate-binding protein n=1 Tax=Desertibacillus haloalkaliphilus TaxID=1328930 RepID=UPI001C27A5EB|nr:C4-dicarboxylate TRAP transporter substrate-binding protein [Desertibacillus haloalkaliphilus]MBU8908308.1 C4-dicarboxylate TRAP transporter substrate-binding protein [Desertibacillus haloalkaliphilus]
MKKVLKLLPVAVVMMLIMITTACSSDSSTTDTSSTGGESEGASEGETIEINVAYGNQPDEPIDKFAQKWKELVEEESNGQIELNLYPSSQLGSEKDVIEQATMGNNVIVLAGYDFLMDYVPDAGILTAPYLVESMDDLLYLTTTDWFEGLRSDLNGEGLDIIANTVYGERHLLTNEKVLSPEDLNGMKIRVPNNQMSIATFEAMGAAATPTPLGDLYTSLQQGLIDGAENPLSVLQGVKAHEVSQHLSFTGHQKFIISWVGGTSFIDSLPEDVVQTLRDTGIEAGEYGKQVLEEQNEEVLAEFEELGVEFYEVDIDPFRESVQGVYEEFPNWTPGLYEEIQELLEHR